uniref:AbrB/MazE/SpoVT family DNA-binding domain-containing protein n=1 Tax=Thermofilum pendens TaxID=2269 RepID=A0A7C1TAC3_THEPE
MELLLKVDSKGRVLIPRALREQLGIRKLVKARVEGGRVVLEPVGDPVELLERAVVEGTEDVEGEIGELRRVAEVELRKLVEG